ncbi:MAG: response regulator [Neomegalonema sp.]|nr:response regulator [Neomegalonema sp.]
MAQVAKKPTVLIVEDCADDFEFAKRALEDAEGCEVDALWSESAADALHYLQGCKNRIGNLRPDLMIVDLNMPGMSGQSLIKELKDTPEWRSIPIIVMTNSQSKKDIEACYDCGANTYMRKALEWDDFVDSMWLIKKYWLETASLASPAAPAG